MKILSACVALFLLSGCSFLKSANYDRVVDRTPDEVVTALSDLDIADQPGSPGTDPSLAGGVTPIIRRERTKDGVVWKVYSGNDVAMTMTAILTPVDNGARTRVTAMVERGNAPDDFVSPAFRSEGVTLGLFSMALEDELNKATLAMASDPQTCRALLDEFQRSNMATPDLHDRRNLRDSIGDVAKISMKMQAYQAQARKLGCEEYFGAGGFSAEPRPAPDGWDEPAESSDGGWGL